MLIIIIIIIIIIILQGRNEYRIYSREVRWKKGKKSCPEYDKVAHERRFQNSLSNQGQDLLPLLPLKLQHKQRLPPTKRTQKRTQKRTRI